MRKSGLTKRLHIDRLLVVVAIISILAAVGVVAYNGYTASAKVTSTKSIYGQLQKYIRTKYQDAILEKQLLWTVT